MSNDVIEQLRRYLDYAVETSVTESATASALRTSSQRWWQRGPVLAVITAGLVLAVALPVLLFSPGSQPHVGSPLADPLEVGVDHVWPESGFSGSPEEVAAEFAREALGWTDLETVVDPEAAAGGPVWVTIKHPGSYDLEVLTVPIGGDRQVLAQVGSAVRITTGPNPDGGGQWIGIPPNLGAKSAFVHIRFVDPDRVEVVRADENELARRRIEITSDSPIGGVVVVYLDEAGQAFTAAGGHFGPLGNGEEPDSSPDATYTTHVDAEGNVWIVSDCPNTDQLLEGNPDGLPHISSVQTREEIVASRGDNEDSRIIPRNGEVWDRTADGEIVVTRVEDYMIEVTLDDISRCPGGGPSSVNGLQVIYRISAND